MFQSHKCFIDVFEIQSPFIVTHNKYIINVALTVMVALIRFSDMFYLVVPKHFFKISLICPLDISPPKTPYEVMYAQGFIMGFYSI